MWQDVDFHDRLFTACEAHLQLQLLQARMPGGLEVTLEYKEPCKHWLDVQQDVNFHDRLFRARETHLHLQLLQARMLGGLEVDSVDQGI